LALEVNKLPLSSCVMWFHALIGMDEHGLALEIKRSIIRNYRS